MALNCDNIVTENAKAGDDIYTFLQADKGVSDGWLFRMPLAAGKVMLASYHRGAPEEGTTYCFCNGVRLSACTSVYLSLCLSVQPFL